MIAEVALLSTLTLGTVPGVSADPFLPDMTVTDEAPDGTLTVVPAWKWQPYRHFASHPAYRNPIEVFAPDVPMDEPLIIADDGGVASTNGYTVVPAGACVAPAVGDIDDWTTFKEVHIGIVLEDFDIWDWPGTPIGNVAEGLNLLRDMLHDVFSSMERDALVIAKVAHINIRHVNIGFADDYGAVEHQWQTEPLLTAIPVSHVLRIHKGSGGRAQYGGYCSSSIAVGHVGVYFNRDLTNDNERRNRMHFVAHELMHMVGVLPHIQCCKEPDGVTWLEQCPDPTAECYHGDWVCPELTEMSYMSPCAHCKAFLDLPNPEWPKLQVGPRGGAMARIFRNNVLARPACFTDVNVPLTLAWFSDTDHDSIPDLQDNCLLVKNEEQWDRESDNIGDACTVYCAVGPGNGRGVWLLLPALALVWWRRR